ncbi:hypothetical protein I6N96_03355 [Enterococcus sp. BWM-S5]|uniref:Uncharacterized protein n=1 Tax=Enterococcus larvae TaxID=2794352 RepID=A0ABS4CF91_9ENTE|nr:hypothetical protein [Enterococcus larvae]MBP1045300.1 hypothetical protein [Enterococcus larvae]
MKKKHPYQRGHKKSSNSTSANVKITGSLLMSGEEISSELSKASWNTDGTFNARQRMYHRAIP